MLLFNFSILNLSCGIYGHAWFGLVVDTKTENCPFVVDALCYAVKKSCSLIEYMIS